MARSGKQTADIIQLMSNLNARDDLAYSLTVWQAPNQREQLISSLLATEGQPWGRRLGAATDSHINLQQPQPQRAQVTPGNVVAERNFFCDADSFS